MDEPADDIRIMELLRKFVRELEKSAPELLSNRNSCIKKINTKATLGEIDAYLLKHSRLVGRPISDESDETNELYILWKCIVQNRSDHAKANRVPVGLMGDSFSRAVAVMLADRFGADKLRMVSDKRSLAIFIACNGGNVGVSSGFEIKNMIGASMSVIIELKNNADVLQFDLEQFIGQTIFTVKSADLLEVYRIADTITLIADVCRAVSE